MSGSKTIFGLRDVGEYKLYMRGAEYFAGHKNNERLRRVRLTRAVSDQLQSKPKSDFVAGIEALLCAAKTNGLPTYCEVKHG